MRALRMGFRFTLAVAATVATLAFVHPGQAADDVNAMFQMGKAAYYRGDLELAQQLLTQVQQRDPRHFETRALLAQIRVSLKSTGDQSLKRKYEGVMLTKIEFSDVTFGEALEGLRVLSKNATEGKVMPNFIVQDPALNDKPVSLHLNGLPLTEAISYLARVAGARAVYEKHAVLFTSNTTANAGPTEGAASGKAP